MRNFPVAWFRDLVALDPVNDLERVLQRCILSGARASLLRALARSNVCLLAAPASGAASGRVPVTSVADAAGRHALIYTSYEQLAAAIPAQIGAVLGKLRKLVKLRPMADPKVSSTSEIAEARTMPAMTAAQST